MPRVDITVASGAPAIVTVIACQLCVRLAEYVDTTTEPGNIADHVFEGLGWARIAGDEYVCDRCRHHPDVAHLLLANNGGSIL